MRNVLCQMLAVVIAIGAVAFHRPTLSADADAGQGEEVVILNTYSYWRAHVTLRPELYGNRDRPMTREQMGPGWQIKDRKSGYITLPPDQPHSPFPPPEWRQTDFDDSTWWRTPGPFLVGGPHGRYGHIGHSSASRGYHMPYGVALLCARGTFKVTEPNLVKDLYLSLAYRGGVVVYLNGKETARSHLPTGKMDLATLAEDYPREVFTTLEGALLDDDNFGVVSGYAAYLARGEVRLDPRDRHALTDEELERGKLLQPRLERRIRKLKTVLPVELLQQGLNVLAIEVHRSAIDPRCPFCPCGLVKVELKTSSGKGIRSNSIRPEGVQVWTANVVEDVLDVDYGDPAAETYPIRVTGTRNGTFSGQVVVSADEPITSLRAYASDLVLKGGGGRIPASGVKVRYALRTRLSRQSGGTILPRFPLASRYGMGGVQKFGELTESPPSEVPVRSDAKSGVKPGFKYVFGAVQPIWVSVRVPADAAPGEYEGRLKVQMEGTEAVHVPIRLKVCEWRLPDGRDYQTLVDFVQSPESVALYYKVPMWSEAHFAHLEKSIKLLSEIGDKTVYIPLIGVTHFGNEQSMVRWMPEADGTYTYDFSVMERYLDLCQKYMGKPKIVCFHVWDLNLGTGAKHSALGPTSGTAAAPEGVTVSELIPATGEVRALKVPLYLYADPEARRAWIPLAEELYERMQRRGLEKAMMLGIAGDYLPPQDYVSFWKGLLPDVPWVLHSHATLNQLYDTAPIDYRAVVFGDTRWAVDPACHRFRGWQRPDLTTLFPRVFTPGAPNCFFRLLPAWNIHGEQNGIGRLPGDFFPITIERGNRTSTIHLYKRYPISWGNAALGKMGAPLLMPGSHGPIPTIRFELLREGVQECEARIFIEQALLDKGCRANLGEKLAARCQAVLDEKTRYNIWVFNRTYVNYNSAFSLLPGNVLPPAWYSGSGWQERSEKLYTAAAEVVRALEEK